MSALHNHNLKLTDMESEQLEQYLTDYLSVPVDELIEIYCREAYLDIPSNCIVDLGGGVGAGISFGGIYINIIKIIRSIPNFIVTKREIAEKAIIEKYIFLKKEFCRSELVQLFVAGKILEFEFVLELAKLIIQRTGEGMDIAALVSVFIVKIGIKNFCTCKLPAYS